MADKELVEKLIKEQDLIGYALAGGTFNATFVMENYTEKIPFYKLVSIIIENEEVLQNYSIENLVNVAASLSSKKDAEKIKQIEGLIIDKMKNEKFSCELIEQEILGMQVVYPINRFFNNLEDKSFDIIKNDALSRLKKVEKSKYSEIVPYLNNPSSIASFLKLFESGELTYEKFQVMKEFIEEDSNIFNTLNFDIFNDEIYSLGKDFIKDIAKFPNLSKELSILRKNNPELLSVIDEEIKKSSNLKGDYEKIKNLINCFTLNCFKLDCAELTLSNKKDLIDWALSTQKQKADINKINVEYSENYREKFIEKCDKNFNTSISIEKKKNVILNRFFSLSLKEAIRMLEDYPEEINENDVFKKVQSILDLTTLEEVNDIYNNYSGIELTQSEVMDLLSKIKDKYYDKYESVLKDTDEKLKNMEYENIECEGKQIKQINLMGNFNIFVHSSDAGFVNEANLKNNSFKESWGSGKDVSNHVISMCYIDQDFLGCAPVHDNGVMYGFTNINSEKIGTMGKSDINTYSRNFGYSSKDTAYFSPDNMTSNARRVYAEVGVERENTTPDYIVLFSDADEKVRENSYKAATEFNIPILFIDKELMRDQQLAKLDDLMSKFKETKDVQVLKEIFNQYETNVAGWLLNRTTTEKDESFTKDIDNSLLDESFKKKFLEIKNVFSEYVSGFKKEDIIGNAELLKVMSIFLSENDKYMKTEEVKPISKTHISFDISEFIKEINEVFKDTELEKYSVDVEQVPTEREYKLSIEEFIKDALRGKQIDIDEVREVEAIKSRNMNKDKGIRNIGGEGIDK